MNECLRKDANEVAKLNSLAVDVKYCQKCINDFKSN